MTVAVFLTDDAIDDLLSLDRSVQKRVLAKILRLEQSVDVGLPLGSVHGQNLGRLRKIVVGDRQWRIIFRPSADDAEAVVTVIGKRSDDECYRLAWQRLNDPNDPLQRSLAEVLTMMGELTGLDLPDKAERMKGKKTKKRRRFPRRR